MEKKQKYIPDILFILIYFKFIFSNSLKKKE